LRAAAAVLVAVAVLVVLAGAFVALGGSDPASETGQLGHPVLVGMLMAAIAFVCGAAGLRLRAGRAGSRRLGGGATVLLAAMAAFRLWRFGVVALGDVAVVLLLAALLAAPEPDGPSNP
jgi:hypothetical protein